MQEHFHGFQFQWSPPLALEKCTKTTQNRSIPGTKVVSDRSKNMAYALYSSVLPAEIVEMIRDYDQCHRWRDVFSKGVVRQMVDRYYDPTKLAYDAGLGSSDWLYTMSSLLEHDRMPMAGVEYSIPMVEEQQHVDWHYMIYRAQLERMDDYDSDEEYD